VVNVTPRRLYSVGDSLRVRQGAGWAPGAVWTGAENIASTGIRSPDRPARSESLYRLRYPGPVGQLVPKVMAVYCGNKRRQENTVCGQNVHTLTL